MRITDGNLSPSTDTQGVIGRQVTSDGPVDENAARSGAGDEVSALSKGGSNTAAIDPGLTEGGQTGGGRAMPDAGVFENQNSLGDNDTMDDSSSMTAGAASGAIGNNDDSGSGSPMDARQDALSAAPEVGVNGGGKGSSESGGLPTGAMPTGGATGGAPTGNLAGSYGEEGR